MYSQPLNETYRNYRKRGAPASKALAMARNATAPVYAHPGVIGPRFDDSGVRGYSYVTRGYRWIENATRGLGWRLAGYADTLGVADHNGWYCDAHQDALMRGVVYRLPHGRFVYGYADPNNEDCALIVDQPCDDEKDAARWADSTAEHFAEREREHSELWSAASYAVDTVRDARTAVLRALEDVRALETCDAPCIRRTILETFTSEWRDYRAAVSRRTTALDDAARREIYFAEF